MGERQRGPGRDAPLDSAVASRLDHETIFRALIAQELRAGRLNRARRKRIVQYAAQLGLTAVQSGVLITECRDAALLSADATEREFALRLANSPADEGTGSLRTMLIVAAAVATVSISIHLFLS